MAKGQLWKGDVEGATICRNILILLLHLPSGSDENRRRRRRCRTFCSIYGGVQAGYLEKDVADYTRHRNGSVFGDSWAP